MIGKPVEYHDYLVTGVHGLQDPDGLDRTLQSLGPACLISDPEYLVVDGCYVMRVFGDPGFIKFAVQRQGYCRIVREITTAD